jgi:phosphoenolpyruvate carboxykinase (ATP)
MALHPTVYANMLGEKIAQHQVHCWLVNTGWTGGPFGEGQRMKIAYTRAMVNAALDGRLAQVATEDDAIFGLNIPRTCPEVPPEVLKPRNTWKSGNAYDEKAKYLAGLFHKNFEQFSADVSEAIRAAGPRMGK